MDSKSANRKGDLGGSQKTSTRTDSAKSSENSLDSIDPFMASVIKLARHGLPHEPDEELGAEQKNQIPESLKPKKGS